MADEDKLDPNKTYMRFVNVDSRCLDLAVLLLLDKAEANPEENRMALAVDIQIAVDEFMSEELES